jgi:signal transduction histidine kinase
MIDYGSARGGRRSQAVSRRASGSRKFTAVAARGASFIRVVEGSTEKPLARAVCGRTRRILRILVDNAIMHTPEGTTITIDTEISEAPGTIAVADDGPGIDYAFTLTRPAPVLVDA